MQKIIAALMITTMAAGQISAMDSIDDLVRKNAFKAAVGTIVLTNVITAANASDNDTSGDFYTSPEGAKTGFYISGWLGNIIVGGISAAGSMVWTSWAARDVHNPNSFRENLKKAFCCCKRRAPIQREDVEQNLAAFEEFTQKPENRRKSFVNLLNELREQNPSIRSVIASLQQREGMHEEVKQDGSSSQINLSSVASEEREKKDVNTMKHRNIN